MLYFILSLPPSIVVSWTCRDEKTKEEDDEKARKDRDEGMSAAQVKAELLKNNIVTHAKRPLYSVICEDISDTLNM